MHRLRNLVNQHWRHSLHRRIAIGMALTMVLMLALQASALLWLTEQSRRLNEDTRIERRNLSRLIAARLGQISSLDTSEVNLPSYLADAIAASGADTLHYGTNAFVVLADGRVAGSPSDGVIKTVVDQLQSARLVPRVWEEGTYSVVPLMVRGEPIGVVGIAPLSTAQRFGWVIAVLSGAFVLLGSMMCAILVGRTIRVRIDALQAVAGQVGEGNLSARSVPSGDDEIADLARAFNVMAGQLEQRDADWRLSDRLRRQLIADVSHELKTPLTSVIAHLETLAQPDASVDSARAAHFASIAYREALRLKRIVLDLIDATRLESGTGDLTLQEFAASDLLARLRDRHALECKQRQIALELSASPDSLAIVADPFRLEQAIDNLIANSIRHSTAGAAIAVRLERRPDELTVSVMDTGEGIPEAELPLVFERFYRGSSPNTKRSVGSGLGLSIVRAIVTRHGGTVSAKSTLGSGTTVEMHLPVSCICSATKPKRYSEPGGRQ
ncbi:MAG: ATP-binding protein [Vicinamibacterales bacterium]